MYKRLILTIVLFILVIIRIIDLKVFKYQEYYNNYLIKSDNTILGPTPIRGKILDTNGKVIVDNKIVNNIIYRKINNNNEIDIAKLLIDKLTLTKEATINELKLFYIENNDTNYLLSEEEINDYRFNN